jgi:methylation protein EvaC
MCKHFELIARHLLETELTSPDAFFVEIGSNDGVLLETVHEAGVRHLGVEPSGSVADMARDKGLRVRTAFFEEALAVEIAEAEGRADVVYSANTICHIPYLDSIFRGLDALLKPGGVFVIEDPYLGDIVERTSFDQIYDEHFYLFAARSVQALSRRFGFDLVDVERIPVHGGEVRYTIARRGERTPSPSVAEMIAEEEAAGLDDPATLRAFGAKSRKVRDDLLTLLHRLRDEGKRVAAYGATGKSATLANFCGIGPELVSAVYDATPAKQHRLTPGSHIPVQPVEKFRADYPDYTLLFAWNHAEEIMIKERGYREAGGKWIVYVPEVAII